MVSHAIGTDYIKRWKEYSFPCWDAYCQKHNLGLVLIDDEIPAKNKKNIYWEKFLIPSYLSSLDVVNNICYVDTDVIINPFSDNIFNHMDVDKVNLISQKNNLQNIKEITIRKKAAYHRNKFLDNNYPLQSSLFMSYEEIYSYHNLSILDDYACTGVFLLNKSRYGQKLKEWYHEIPQDIITIDNGEEVFLNYYFQKFCDVNWLGYEWQALWLYEVAGHYTHLYREKFTNSRNVEAAILDCLLNFNFLHFAGSWESSCWAQAASIFSDPSNVEYLRGFKAYEDLHIDSRPRSQTRPLKGFRHDL